MTGVLKQPVMEQVENDNHYTKLYLAKKRKKYVFSIQKGKTTETIKGYFFPTFFKKIKSKFVTNTPYELVNGFYVSSTAHEPLKAEPFSEEELKPIRESLGIKKGESKKAI